jgi:cytochrome c oxidase subunit 3
MNKAIATTQPRRIHPKRFALWIAMASIIMLFAAFTSAIVVRQAAGNWQYFKLPDAFFFSTGFIIASSILVHGALISFKEGKETLYKALLLGSFFLGLAFIIAQYQGWMQLKEIGITLHGNVSGSFLLLVTGMHVLHVLGGICALLLATIKAFTTKFNITPKRILNLELTITYWHFVDVLWIYLLVFFITQQP